MWHTVYQCLVLILGKFCFSVGSCTQLSVLRKNKIWEKMNKEVHKVKRTVPRNDVLVDQLHHHCTLNYKGKITNSQSGILTTLPSFSFSDKHVTIWLQIYKDKNQLPNQMCIISLFFILYEQVCPWVCVKKKDLEGLNVWFVVFFFTFLVPYMTSRKRCSASWNLWSKTETIFLTTFIIM